MICQKPTCLAALLVSALLSGALSQRANAEDLPLFTELPFFGTANGSLTSAPDDPEASGPFVFDYVLETNLTGTGTRTESAFFGPDNTLFGTQIWTAEDGDDIFVEFVGDITSETTAEGIYDFVGGTGKFVGAFGQADFTAVFPDFSDVAIEFTGTLTLVPEPSSLLLVGLASLLCSTHRRRAR